MKKIIIETISHKDQRYDTCGDWQFDTEGNLKISISDVGNWKHEFLVAFHELAEVMLCKDRGISQESVDAFDTEFEKNRKEGNTDEPGNDSAAPYRKEHFFATNVERLMAEQLGVDWDEYDKSINSL